MKLLTNINYNNIDKHTVNNYIKIRFIIEFDEYITIVNNFFNFSHYSFGDWGLGIGDWGLGIGSNIQFSISNI